jgi:hypothetical protein
MAGHLKVLYVIQLPSTHPATELNISGFTDSGFADRTD